MDPDIEVTNDPQSVIDGKDPQLKPAIAEVMAAMERKPRRPPFDRPTVLPSYRPTVCSLVPLPAPGRTTTAIRPSACATSNSDPRAASPTGRSMPGTA